MEEKINFEESMANLNRVVSELEKGDIPLEKALILADFYNVSIDYIAGRTNDKKGFNKSDLPPSEVDLLKKFRTLTEKQRGIIIGRIEAFTEENAEISEKEERLKGAV